MPTNTPPESIPILLETIEIPDSAYEKAEARYEDIYKWLCRPESTCREYIPSIFPQGSFLLGTVTRPPDADGEYDLDIVVKLKSGISKALHTQKELKTLVGRELEAYRKARQIEQALDEKRRCWRLHYKDQMSFHIDVVPCIPEEETQRRTIKEAMVARNTDETLADEVANLTVSITDNERPDYEIICPDWNVSNPQGYGRWFASRVRLAERTVRKRLMEEQASVEDLPAYKLKAPLQRCVQILKQHRNVMFKDEPDCQPISIIITTLAAQAYEGQEDVTEALLHIVDTMDEHIRPNAPRVPNPVNPPNLVDSEGEDFSDKWHTPEGRELDLEGNFFSWLEQARVDFHRLAGTRNAKDLNELAETTLGLSLGRELLRERLGSSAAASSAPAIAKPTQQIEDPPKPWAAQ